jgi:polysaccharide deacetylase family protein (PEP-CTERM system associated)
MRPPPSVPRRHILTVGLEDYFQVGAFNRFVQRNQWYRFETRLERNTDRTLALLKQHGATGTFFVLGWVAARFPELLRRVADAGHEVGVKGYYHRSIGDMTPEEFEADCLRAKAAVEAATGRPAVGYRVANGWLRAEDLWALESLARCGFRYDSSIARFRGMFADQPFRGELHTHPAAGGPLWEVPVSTARVAGVRVPVAGGNYLRQLPGLISRRAAAKWVADHPDAPLVAYFHVWELDPDQPRLAIGSWLTQLRHYRNLDQMPAKLGRLLTDYQFTSAATSLQLDTAPADVPLAGPDTAEMPRLGDAEPETLTHTPLPAADRTPVTVVVPCFNEEDTLPYLGNTLRRLRRHLNRNYDVRFVLVDDGSSDRTWDGLQTAFAGQPGFDLVRHDVNCGVAAAILTGIKRAGTEVVASIDADCSYDPLELEHMLPKLGTGVSVVTASPYHPLGKVRNVPGWRLGLSRGAAWLYRRVLRTKLYTYTSCFRVYRRSLVAGFQVRHPGYLGVAEHLARVDLTGGEIVEHPAVLEVRLLGRSKMKVARTVLGHLGLLAKLAYWRATGQIAKPHRDVVIKSVLASHRDKMPVLIRHHDPKPDPASSDVRKAVLQPAGQTP